MASPINSATDSTVRLFSFSRASGDSGTVSVTQIASMPLSQMRSTAGPAKIGCVADTVIDRAPRSRRNLAALHTVPAVVIMSSNIKTSKPSTLPIKLTISIDSPSLRRLSMTANSPPNREA